MCEQTCLEPPEPEPEPVAPGLPGDCNIEKCECDGVDLSSLKDKVSHGLQLQPLWRVPTAAVS